MKLNRDSLQKRFHELGAERAKILAKSEPLREARDKVAARHAKEIAGHNKKLRDAEKGLYDIDVERAMIARAIGNVGDPEAGK